MEFTIVPSAADGRREARAVTDILVKQYALTFICV